MSQNMTQSLPTFYPIHFHSSLGGSHAFILVCWWRIALRCSHGQLAHHARPSKYYRFSKNATSCKQDHVPHIASSRLWLWSEIPGTFMLYKWGKGKEKLDIFFCLMCPFLRKIDGIHWVKDLEYDGHVIVHD